MGGEEPAAAGKRQIFRIRLDRAVQFYFLVTAALFHHLAAIACVPYAGESTTCFWTIAMCARLRHTRMTPSMVGLDPYDRASQEKREIPEPTKIADRITRPILHFCCIKN